MRFRKKPVEIEAFQLTDEQRKEGGPFPEWALPHLKMERTEKIENSERIRVVTLEGEIYANAGDFIIQGVQGEVYPCKPDIFAETYDEVS